MTAALPANLAERVLDVVRRQSRGRPLGHLHLAPLRRDLGAVRPRHGAARRRDRRRRRHRAGRRGEDRRADARRPRSRRPASPRDAPAQRGRAGRRPAAPRACAISRVGTKLNDVSFDLARRRGRRRRRARRAGPGRAVRRALPARSGRRAASIEVDGQPVQFAHPADAIAPASPMCRATAPRRSLMQRSVRENIALPFSAAPAQLGADQHAPGARQGRRRHRAAADRHARAARGAAPVRRQPAEGDDRPLDRRRGAHHPLLRPDARHRCRAPSRRSTGCCASSPAQGTSVLFYTSELEEVQLRLRPRHRHLRRPRRRHPAGRDRRRGGADARRLWPAARRARPMSASSPMSARRRRSAAVSQLLAPPGLGRRPVRAVRRSCSSSPS